MDNILLIIQNFDVAIKFIADEYPIVLFTLYFAFAASIGSFLGCCYYRIPRKMSLINPKRSFCPNCKTELTFFDLVPIFSYTFLRAKCRHCGIKIAPTYFIIEILTVVFMFLLLYLFL
jgi:leader peptidase (prepilin peptidase)/N-methyltransferase|tara:strand:+ start:867 stop:1220 length:354 start_codon:yes stop_codon:yes gene_type:complete